MCLLNIQLFSQQPMYTHTHTHTYYIYYAKREAIYITKSDILYEYQFQFVL